MGISYEGCEQMSVTEPYKKHCDETIWKDIPCHIRQIEIHGPNLHNKTKNKI